jgi:hypothetical protein
MQKTIITKLEISGGALELNNMHNRPDISQTLNSLKSAMTADKDQILEDEYEHHLTVELENTVSDETVEVAVPLISVTEEDDSEAVFCSETDSDVEEIEESQVLKAPKKDNDVFVLSKMIQEDGTVVNLEVAETRPNIGMSEEKIEGIVREEAKSILKTWIDNNMYHILKKRNQK